MRRESWLSYCFLVILIIICALAFWRSVVLVSGNNSSVNSRKDFSLKFVVLGDTKILPDQPDWRGNKILSKIIEEINTESPDFVVYLGDGPDFGGPVANMCLFREYLNRLKCPWYTAIGNHEIMRGAGIDGKSGDGEDNYLEVFADKLPLKDPGGNRVSYYSFDFAESHFVIIDTAWQDRGKGPYALYPGSRQWNWLVSDLEKAARYSRHIFICGHEPPLIPYRLGDKSSSLKYDSSYGTTWSDASTVEAFVLLCSQYKVDAVFSGHFHGYMSFKEGETRHIITGGAGADLHTLPEYGGYYHYTRCFMEGSEVKYEVKRI